MKDIEQSVPADIKTTKPNRDSTSPNMPDLKRKLTTADIKMAEDIAGQIARRVPSHISKDDLIAAGMLGLTEARNNYDPSKGDFSAYASQRIRGAVIDELRKGDVLPRRERAKIKKQKAAGLRDDSGPRAETLDSAYEKLGSNHPHAENGLYENLKSPATQKGEAIESEQKNIIRAIVAKLDPHLQNVYHMYFDEELTCKEIGNKLGVTTSRVSQILTEIKGRIKESLPKDLIK